MPLKLPNAVILYRVCSTYVYFLIALFLQSLICHNETLFHFLLHTLVLGILFSLRAQYLMYTFGHVQFQFVSWIDFI